MHARRVPRAATPARPGGRTWLACENARFWIAAGRAVPARDAPHQTHQKAAATMDIEQINAIGTALTDLSERTAALRGYL